jgi:hypothetical protein
MSCHEAILPRKTSKASNCRVKDAIPVVMSPDKLLRTTSNHVRFKFLQITSGMWPDNRLLKTERLKRLLQLPSSGGISPVKLLSPRDSMLRRLKLPSSGGMLPDNVFWSSMRPSRNSNFPRLAEILPSSVGSCADKLMLRTRPLSVQLMPPHEHGDASEAFQSSSRGEMVVKALLNSIRAKPSGVKATAIPTNHVRKVTRAKFHLRTGVSESMLAIEPRTSALVYLSRNGSVQSWFIHIYHQECSAMLYPKSRWIHKTFCLPPLSSRNHRQSQRTRNMSNECGMNSSALLVINTQP